MSRGELGCFSRSFGLGMRLGQGKVAEDEAKPIPKALLDTLNLSYFGRFSRASRIPSAPGFTRIGER